MINESVEAIKVLRLYILGKNFSRQYFETFFIFFFFSLENRIRHFMQIVSFRDNLHEVSGPIFYEK